MDFEISIPTDSEGFFSLQCPHCKERFKITAEDFEDDDTIELFCPSCGLIAECSDFYPEEVIEHAETMARNYMEQEIYKVFKNGTKGSGLTFEGKKPREEKPKLLIEDEGLEEIELHCCDKTIKVNMDQKVANVYCPFCGVN
ncbi:hypothetical protein [Cytobacillus oceanisediminis]|uniref:hypothetical protein n=1 Tax=Cytobacillus oceanisediminis TaxID=665099 RepID=UPI0024940821|nr:hypothetical protein [Cytobacillus oceanisediminis]